MVSQVNVGVIEMFVERSAGVFNTGALASGTMVVKLLVADQLLSPAALVANTLQ